MPVPVVAMSQRSNAGGLVGSAGRAPASVSDGPRAPWGNPQKPEGGHGVPCTQRPLIGRHIAQHSVTWRRRTKPSNTQAPTERAIAQTVGAEGNLRSSAVLNMLKRSVVRMHVSQCVWTTQRRGVMCRYQSAYCDAHRAWQAQM